VSSFQLTHQPKVIGGDFHFAVNRCSVAQVGNERNWICLIATQMCWQTEFIQIEQNS
jgi:hypothetical protein